MISSQALVRSLLFLAVLTFVRQSRALCPSANLKSSRASFACPFQSSSSCIVSVSRPRWTIHSLPNEDGTARWRRLGFSAIASSSSSSLPSSDPSSPVSPEAVECSGGSSTSSPTSKMSSSLQSICSREISSPPSSISPRNADPLVWKASIFLPSCWRLVAMNVHLLTLECAESWRTSAWSLSLKEQVFYQNLQLHTEWIR